jgi:hypothetical protein
LLAELAAFEDGDVHGLEEIRSDRVGHDAHTFVLRRRVARHRHVTHVASAGCAHRYVAGQGGALYLRRIAHLLPKRTLKCHSFLLRVARTGEVDRRDQGVLRLESRIAMNDVPQCPHQQATGNQQDEADSELQADQRMSPPPVANTHHRIRAGVKALDL